MKYKAGLKKYISACEKAGIQPLDVIERSSYERGGGWTLRAISPGSPGLGITVCLIDTEGRAMVGQELRKHIAMRQRQSMDAQHWVDSTLPALKQQNRCPDPAPVKSKPRVPMTTQYNPQPAKAKSPFDRG
jgi:hypothetical protein